MFLVSIRRQTSWSKRSRSINFAGMLLAALCATGTTTSSPTAAVAATQTTPADPSLEVLGWGEGSTTALLVALQDGPAGKQALEEWSAYAGNFGFEEQEEGEEEEQEYSSFAMPSVWILCTDTETALLADELPHVQPLLSTPDHPWAEALEDFVLQNEVATVFGLLGEGALPPPDLGRSIRSLEQALAGSAVPTAVLTRSRSKGDDSVAIVNNIEYDAPSSSQEGMWLPDSFVSQVWLNADMLGLERVQEAGLVNHAVEDLPLLRILPRLTEDPNRIGAIIVDGTSVIGSVFALGGDKEQSLLSAATSDREALRIGSSDYTLVEGEDGVVEIATAPWPPRYVLETVANEDGLVIVNNVNCGYLDFATNFLRSVRRVSDAKVLWVTMDDVAFDFMDNLAPGCAAMFPSEGSERHHAIGAGTMGDATFQSQVLVRPSILQSVLAAGYTVLWTDSDVVWLGNPLPLLPDINDPESAEVMLQHDGNAGNKCTCFMYLQPTDIAKELLVLWKKSIIDSDAVEDQNVPGRDMAECDKAAETFLGRGCD